MQCNNQPDSPQFVAFAPAKPAPLPLLMTMLRPLVGRFLRDRNIRAWQVRLRCHVLPSLTQFEPSLETSLAKANLAYSMVHYLTQS